MGWFVGMFFLPFLSKHSVYLAEHNWLPYFILLAFAIAGGIFILCVQKVPSQSCQLGPVAKDFRRIFVTVRYD